MYYILHLLIVMIAWSLKINLTCSQSQALHYEGEDISSLPKVFETNRLPEANEGTFLSRYMASIGNGHLATVIYTNVVFMNGLYNGLRGESHRAIIPSRNNIRVALLKDSPEVVHNHSFALDVEKGTFIEKFIFGDFQVEERIFAHRYYHKIIVNQIYIKPLLSDPLKTLELELVYKQTDNNSADIDFDLEREFASTIPSKYTCGKTLQAEDLRYQDGLSNVCIIRSELPEKIRASSEVTFTYFASYDRTLEGAAEDYAAVASLISSESHEEIYSIHVKAWKQVWNDGRIEVEGNLELSKVIYGCLYYILSSLPITSQTYSTVGQFHGLSPSSLAYGSHYEDYQGHSFWDTEIWMYPVIAYFYPEAAREILNYRLYIVKPSRDFAKQTGYRGIRFPWEGGVTGADVTPDCCQDVRDNQVHITGDVAFAIRQYISLTRDLEWLRVTQPNYLTNGCGLLREIAEFWISRITYDKASKRHVIKGVMPPDPHSSGVDNNGFTNLVAGYAVFFAKFSECLCNGSMEPFPEKWVHIAKSLKMVYDPVKNYHPEFETYNLGDLIQQADVVLLGFPLLYQMDPETRKNDLNIYEKATVQNGPAMTWAFHAIGHLEFDEVERAEIVFNRSYQSYVRQPFKIWTANQPPTLGTVNFITGMGGFLQAVVSGYGGYRLFPNQIVFNKPRVPPKSKSMNLVVDGNTEIILNNEPPISFTIKPHVDSNCPLPVDQIDFPYEENSGGMKSENLVVMVVIFLLQQNPIL